MVDGEPDRPAVHGRLRRADRYRPFGGLAGRLAHDFNNVLSAISGYAQLARAEIEPDSHAQEHLAEVVRACERGAEMTARLMAFSRSGEGVPSELDLNAFVAHASGMLRHVLGPANRLVTELEAELPLVSVDPNQIRRLLVNLAVNARDAMPAGGVLTIATCYERLRGAVEITVSDTGTGMDDDVRGRVFEPFFTTKPEGAGSGLGLATVHGIVTGSGGRIAVESAPGAGTTFSIALPTSVAA
jgi:two-component system, cell cycle sensor histidine kinase and response regulator CckA